jgi:ubiquinone/menaquinone biosynthesis C-methylase UbiE
MPDAIAMFAGSMPEFYQRYMVPMLFAPHARVLASTLASIQSGAILELAAGTGAATRELRTLLANAVRIVATDLNDSMLDQARLQPGADSIEWRQAPADALPFPSETFNAAVCQFGVMFFPDKPASFREALRVLRPGGMYVFNVWGSLDHNPLAHVADQVSRSMFPSYQPAGHAIPFAYHDRDTIRRDLTSAGFNQPRFEIVPEFGRASSAQLAAAAYIHGGILRHEIDRQGPGALEHATAAVSQTLSARFGNGEVSIPNQAIMVTAVRP